MNTKIIRIRVAGAAGAATVRIRAGVKAGGLSGVNHTREVRA